MRKSVAEGIATEEAQGDFLEGEPDALEKGREGECEEEATDCVGGEIGR